MTMASLLTGMLCFGFLAFPSKAEACCIYNHTQYALAISTGVLIDMYLPPSEKHCPPGKGGTFYLSLYDTLHIINDVPVSTNVEMKVDKHGWISVYKESGGKWKVVSHHSDGSEREVKYMKKS